MVLIRHWGFRDPDPIRLDNTPVQQFQSSFIIEQHLDKVPELKTGNKMFLRPSVPDLWTFQFPKSENRQHDFYFGCPFEKTDTTVFNLPVGYTVDALPQSRTDTCKYAHYYSRSWYDEKSRQIYSVSGITLHDYKIPARDYATVHEFFDRILMSNEERIIIKNK